MSIWVQLIADNVQPFKVSFKTGMDYDDLKKAIAIERGIPPDEVQFIFIYSANIVADKYRQKAGNIVPIPKENGIGSSDDWPYFYSLAKNQPAQEGIKLQLCSKKTK